MVRRVTFASLRFASLRFASLRFVVSFCFARLVASLLALPSARSRSSSKANSSTDDLAFPSCFLFRQYDAVAHGSADDVEKVGVDEVVFVVLF